MECDVEDHIRKFNNPSSHRYSRIRANISEAMWLPTANTRNNRANCKADDAVVEIK